MNLCTQPSTVYLTPVRLQTNFDRGGAELLKRYRNIVPFLCGIWIYHIIDDDQFHPLDQRGRGYADEEATELDH